MLLFCALLILVVTVYSAPQNQDQNSIDRFSSLLLPVAHPKRQAITSFAPYDKSWEKFKTVQSKFSRTTFTSCGTVALMVLGQFSDY
jgi:hypothetical protein